MAIPMVVGKNHPTQITCNIFPTDERFCERKELGKSMLNSKITVCSSLQISGPEMSIRGPEILKKIESVSSSVVSAYPYALSV